MEGIRVRGGRSGEERVWPQGAEGVGHEEQGRAFGEVCRFEIQKTSEQVKTLPSMVGVVFRVALQGGARGNVRNLDFSNYCLAGLGGRVRGRGWGKSFSMFSISAASSLDPG